MEVLRKPNVSARLVEAVPWLLAHFVTLDTKWLEREAKLRNLQNRLRFLVALAQEVRREAHLEDLLVELKAARLVAEQTLGNDAMPGAQRKWMRAERSSLAAHLNLLTRLDAKAVSRWMLDRG